MSVDEVILYEMPEIKIKIGVDSVKIKPIIELFLPIDYKDWEDSERFIIRVVNTNLNEKIYNEVFYQYNYMIYNDKIPKRGKNKWVLLGSKSNKYKIEDLPDGIWSSLNTHEHPSKRKWFIEKNCGISEIEYVKTNWGNYNKLNYSYNNNDVELHYTLIVLLTKYFVLVFNKKIANNITEWEKIINYQFKQNNPIYSFFTDEYIQEMNETRLRDILNLWEIETK